MQNPEIEARTNKRVSIGVVILLTVALTGFILLNLEEISDWNTFISYVPRDIKLFIFTCVYLLSWLWALDRQPKLIINNEGLWMRKSDFPFRKLYLTSWHEILGFHISDFRHKRVTSIRLIVTFKEGKEKSTQINFLDEPAVKITLVLDAYAKKYHFSGFGSEV